VGGAYFPILLADSAEQQAERLEKLQAGMKVMERFLARWVGGCAGVCVLRREVNRREKRPKM
jgi:hypothetical protein